MARKLAIPTDALDHLMFILGTHFLARAYSGGSDGGGRSPLGKFDAPQGYQNNDFLMSSEKCHIKIFARPPATAMKFYYRRATADLYTNNQYITYQKLAQQAAQCALKYQHS